MLLIVVKTDKSCDCRYIDGPMGKNTISKLLGEMSKRAGVDAHLTGHDLRATFITRASHANISREDIIQRTGHKRTESLDPYIRDNAEAARAKALKFQKSIGSKTLVAQKTSTAVSYNSNSMPLGGPMPLTYKQSSSEVNVPSTVPTMPNMPPPCIDGPPNVPSVQQVAGKTDVSAVLSLYNSGFSNILQQFR